MFGSNNPFGQASGGLFGQTSFGATQQPAFGQSATATNNPFAPKPFGSPTTTFGAQPGSSLFGNTSTGAFGQQTTPAFGTQSSSLFGASTPAFGASSTPAFGASSTPAFGASSTPAFGASSTPAFGASSTPAFGASPTPAFGASPTPAFGATSSAFGTGSLFGQKPSFGGFGSSPSQQSSPFGSTFQQTQPTFGTSAFGATTTPAFGTTTPAFGTTSTPAFGATTTPAFGSTSTSLFGASSNPTFGSSTPGFGSSGTTTFGANSTPGFGASSTPSFGASTGGFSFGSSPSVQTTASFGTTSFGTTASPFGTQNNPFGSQTATPTFGQSFGNQTGGTRIKPYAQTPDVDSATSGTQPAAKLDSISAMLEYKDKSHEELRWEDYQRGDKGGPNPAAASFPSAQPVLPNSTNAFGQTTSNPFSTPVHANPFAAKSSPFPSTGFASTSTQSFNNPFTAAASSTLFGQTSTAPPLFGSTTSGFSSSSLFGSSSTATTPFVGLSSANTQSVGLFQSSPAFVQQPFSQQPAGFPSSTPSLSTGNLFSSPATGMTSSLFGSGSSPFSTSIFQPSAPAQTSSLFPIQTPVQTASTGGFIGFPNTTNQSLFGQIQSNMVMQPAPVSNPFGMLPAMPQMSIGNGGSSPSVQYGISSLPVAEKPLPSRTLSMVVPRHLSQRRIKLLPRKYNPISDRKIPFFADEEEFPATPKADALFIPRENPRNLIIRSIDEWPSWSRTDRQSVLKDSSDLDKNKDTSGESQHDKSAASPSRPSPVENGHKAATQHGNGTSVERLMPKLPRAEDYYTEPSLEKLAAKERPEPGYCSWVRDFVVGRHGYGSIKFFGETDVRGLDLESIVEFNNREVIVYKDDSKKPPVGEGLNKAAEVTLLNIKCVNKKTGEHYRDGRRVDKYREMLVKKAEEQGAEFVSFDAAKGEWKFRVKHFSAYGLW